MIFIYHEDSLFSFSLSTFEMNGFNVDIIHFSSSRTKKKVRKIKKKKK